MKLWYSFLKELKLASLSFYFYIEIFMAVILLFILLAFVPKESITKQKEYIYLDLPELISEQFIKSIEEADLDGKFEEVIIKSKGDEIQTTYYETDDSKIYLVNSEADAEQLADSERNLGAVITYENNTFHYKYFLQGYESDKLKNVYRIFHVKDIESMQESFENQEVVSLGKEKLDLNNRQNIVPAFLTFNGSLMGLFIIAAYIFLDKGEGIIKAYAITASKVWVYLASKVGVLIVTSIITSLMIVVPIMGTQPNYLLLFVFLLASGFFASSLGLYMASFYQNMMQSFSVVYLIMMLFLLPNLAYFIPSWEPAWIKWIPSYPIIQSFKETIVPNGDVSYVLYSSLGFLLAGLALFLLSNYRYKKTLSV